MAPPPSPMPPRASAPMPPRASVEPASGVSPRRPHDTLAEITPGGPWEEGWRPSDKDYSPKATAWRAWHALNRTERHKAELAQFDARLATLGKTIEAGLQFLTTLRKLLLWGGGILGAAALLGIGRLVWVWLSTLHH